MLRFLFVFSFLFFLPLSSLSPYFPLKLRRRFVTRNIHFILLKHKLCFEELFFFLFTKLWRTTFSRSRCTEYNMHKVERDLSLGVKRSECTNHQQPTAKSTHHCWYTRRYLTTCWTKKRDGKEKRRNDLVMDHKKEITCIIIFEGACPVYINVHLNILKCAK